MNSPSSSMTCKFALIADPHYYSASLGITGEAYLRRSASDQKLLAESRAVLLSALADIKRNQPDFLLIAGDLTNDGERCSHEEIRELLREFSKTLPTFVITSTHDWCSDNNPRRYTGNHVLHDVATLEVSELRDYYQDFGPKDAIAEYFTEQMTSSYVVRPIPGLSVFCLNDDFNGNGGAGYSTDHFRWIKEQIDEAKRRNDVFFAIQHHNLGLTALQKIVLGKKNATEKETLCKDFADIGLKLCITGHSHMQSLRRITSDKGNEFYELNVASVDGYPAPILYGNIENGLLEFNTDHLSSFEYNGIVYQNGDFKSHATALFENVLNAAVTNKKETFAALLEAIDIPNEKSYKIWPFIKPVLKLLDKLTVKQTAKFLNFFTFGKAIDKDAAKEIGNIKITEMICDAFCSVLDGSKITHPENSAYYRVFTDATSLPYRIISRLPFKNEKITDILCQVKITGEEIMTGGEFNNNHWQILL